MRYHHISEEKAEYRLHICHIHATHHAGNRNEGHSGNRGADHAKRNHIPRRFILSLEERCIRSAFISGDTGY